MKVAFLPRVLGLDWILGPPPVSYAAGDASFSRAVRFDRLMVQGVLGPGRVAGVHGSGWMRFRASLGRSRLR